MNFPFDAINASGIEEDPNLCFVIMPFDEEYSEIYDRVMKPLVESFNMTCIRADDIYSTNPIMDDVIVSILKANLIVADLTGKNANVFYELGIAHSKKQNVILIAQTLDDVPFDLRSLRIITYKQTIAGAEDLKLALRRTINDFVQEEHVPDIDISESDPIAWEFSSCQSLEQTKFVGLFGDTHDTSQLVKEEREYVTRILGVMYATLISTYEMSTVDLDMNDRRLTFPDGYYVVSTGDFVSSVDVIGSEQQSTKCEVRGSLYISTSESIIADILAAIKDQIELSEVRVHYATPFDIKALVEQAKANGVKIDILLPDRITFNLLGGRFDRIFLSATNDNEIGILEVTAPTHFKMEEPMKAGKDLLNALLSGEVSKEEIFRDFKIHL